MSEKDSNFQNIVSILGLIAAFIAAVIPLFGQSELNKYFIGTSFVAPVTILTVIIGIPLSWNIIENHKLIMIPVKKRGSEYPSYIRLPHVIWFLTLLSTSLLIVFFVAKELNWPSFVQYIIYPTFFLSMFATFSLLLASSIGRMEYENQRVAVPYRILKTLENNGLVKPKIKVIENISVQNSDYIQDKLGIPNEFGGVRIVAVEVDDTEIRAVLSDDLTMLLRKIEPAKEVRND